MEGLEEKDSWAEKDKLTTLAPLPEGFRQLPLCNISLEAEVDDRERVVYKLLEYIEKLREAKTIGEIAEPPVENLIGLASFDTCVDQDGRSKDGLLKIVQEDLFPKYLRRYMELGGQHVYQEGYLEGEKVRAAKVEVKKMLSPGSYFVHAAFTKDLKSIVDDGCLMSPVARRNLYQRAKNGNKKEIHSKDLLIEDNPHASAIFFDLWCGLAKDAGTYIGTIDDPRGFWTDMVIFLPSEVAVKYAKAISIRSVLPGRGTDQEIGITNSQVAISEGKLVYDPNDETKIPFHELYYLLPESCQKEATALFANRGCSNEWISEHLFFVKQKKWFDEGMGGTINDLPQTLIKRRNEINQWLSRRKTKNGKIIIKTYHSDITSEKIYNADFISK